MAAHPNLLICLACHVGIMHVRVSEAAQVPTACVNVQLSHGWQGYQLVQVPTSQRTMLVTVHCIDMQLGPALRVHEVPRGHPPPNVPLIPVQVCNARPTVLGLCVLFFSSFFFLYFLDYATNGPRCSFCVGTCARACTLWKTRDLTHTPRRRDGGMG